MKYSLYVLYSPRSLWHHLAIKNSGKDTCLFLSSSYVDQCHHSVRGTTSKNHSNWGCLPTNGYKSSHPLWLHITIEANTVRGTTYKGRPTSSVLLLLRRLPRRTIISCIHRFIVDTTSEKDSTCISAFVHPNVHVMTCSSFMWPEMHASAEEFTWFLYVRTPLVIASHNLFPRGKKDALTILLIHAN
jgi:hypothetical protein